MRIINNDLVAQLLTMDDCIQAQEAAFKKLPSGREIPTDWFLQDIRD